VVLRCHLVWRTWNLDVGDQSEDIYNFDILTILMTIEHGKYHLLFWGESGGLGVTTEKNE
jgi:hypothetical protein